MSEHNITLTPDAARKLSDALVRRRVELGIRSARQLGMESGLDYRTITGIESLRRDKVSRNTLAVLEMQLQWPAGYLTALLDNASKPPATTIELDVPVSADPKDVMKAREIAKAAFEASLKNMSGI